MKSRRNTHSEFLDWRGGVTALSDKFVFVIVHGVIVSNCIGARPFFVGSSPPSGRRE